MSVLRAVGPRLVSNQTSQPLSIYGEGLRPGQSLRLSAPADVELPLLVLDEGHAYARLPGDVELPADQAQVPVKATLSEGEGSAQLTLVNDRAFPDLVAMASSRDGAMLFAASTTTDQVFALEIASGKVTALSTLDGPVSLATWMHAPGAAPVGARERSREWLVIAHQFSPRLLLLSIDGDLGADRVLLPAPAYAASVLVDGDVAYLAEHAQDTVVALFLAEGGRELWRAKVAPNPRALARVALSPLDRTEPGLVVGSLQTGEVELLDARTGKILGALQPGPGTPIVGGTTQKYAKYVMNGKAPRALAYSRRLGALFLSSIGPNIGPNPDKMEVSMNGGVGVIDPPARRWRRHLGFGAGVTEALALDDEAGLLYASDVGLGLVRVLDAKKLAGADASAKSALISELALPPPEGFPTARPPDDYGVKGRAGASLHSGPKALVLAPDARTLFVLNRFTGSLAAVDVSQAAQGKAALLWQKQVVNTLSQRVRRLGQVLYFADMGRTAMTCDACHLEGHTEGVFFEKTHPLRIYRSSTVRGSRDTPPYFTPASTRSMAETAAVVGGRNRYHNPDPTVAEVEALSLYSSAVTLLPNPFAQPDGSPPTSLTLPDGQVGNARAGLLLFEGKAGCVECHPAPHYTIDQEPATRGRYLDVGTPHALRLRPSMQDLTFEGFAPPALLGSWDVFPMLTSGAAGLVVRPDESLGVSTRFPLRAAILDYPQHGKAAALSEQEQNDLLAFVLSL